MSTLLTDIGELTTNDPDVGRRHDAAIVIEDGRIAWIGNAASAPPADEALGLGGAALLPGWVDTHTHLIFAGDRSGEFEARMAGERYAAGGIAVTVAATREATVDELRANAASLRAEAERGGTTFLETKTGYGLDIDSEVRSARVARDIADSVTFLGAHVVPSGVDAREYVDLVRGPMLAAVRPYVDAIDVFCEDGAFTVDQSREVLLAGRAAGLALRVHGNQLGHSGGVALAVELGARSVDHCNHLTADDIDLLAASDTVATFLPACDLSTREPFGPARQLIDAGATVALATNCNPGTSFTTSMQFCVATAVLQMRLTVEEAVFAATTAAARSVDRDDVGVIRVGARADLQTLAAPGISHLAYRPGVPLTDRVWKDGKLLAR
ncbi:imidazolonepropionase [Microbacterium sp. SLBN-146]|uniref:imidazolonepropionase n=1 Tax=Microbacterium sp. SLBN-146 TaxID=2768457 RepID=UPI001153866D|nr:imidazolonepropionase [Microbacterium sp. SLBN-146]TQJ31840.1 imidazolonepropionase [Microbacterium sp. SLBN-146]